MHLHQRHPTGHGTRKEPDRGDDSAVTRGVSAGSHSTQAEVGRGGFPFPADGMIVSGERRAAQRVCQDKTSPQLDMISGEKRHN